MARDLGERLPIDAEAWHHTLMAAEPYAAVRRLDGGGGRST
jgi:hypothetical protein